MRELQPSARSCFVCGVDNPSGLHLRFYDSAPGEVSAEVTISSAHQGYPGVVHGGVIAAMLDEVASRTVFTASRIVVTAKMDIRYRKPASTHTPLRLIGRLLEDRGRVCRASGQLMSQDGMLLAEAEVTLVEVAPEYLEAMTPDEQEGWRVYPEDYRSTTEVNDDH